MMKATELLHNLGQSLWLDNITRDLLNSGTLKRYIDELSVTGLTSNPTIFDHAIKNSTAYDAAIREKPGKDKSGEAVFFELALEDITRAAALFRPVHDQTDGVDGWVSLEVSPLLAYDTASTLAAAKDLHARAGRPNLFIKIPGTKEGLPAIEEAIFAGIPINVTLLFSREHYVSAAEAFLRGIERRIEAGLRPAIGSVASVFISRWDAGVIEKVPDSLRDQLGIAIAKRTYKAYRALLASPRWQRVFNAGARPFEYGDDFAKHTEAFHPTFCKVLVRYNPEGDKTLNGRQSARLKRLSDYLHSESRSLFMFELLVPAQEAQLEKLKGDKKAYDLEVRPRLMVQTIQQLQDAQVEPDVWKIEGMDLREDCEKVVAAAHRGGRDKVGCIILGRGEDDKKVREWLTTAAGVPGFIGFAVGRTDFWEPLVNWRAKKTTREAAVTEIARCYREFVDIFEKAHARAA